MAKALGLAICEDFFIIRRQMRINNDVSILALRFRPQVPKGVVL